MTIAFDASTVALGFGSTSSPIGATHTPVGTPKGVLVYVLQGLLTASLTPDDVTSVTYGGVSMDRIGTVAALESTSESLRIYTYFLGTGIPSGAQEFFCYSGGVIKDACAVTVTASSDTEIVDWVSAQTGTVVNQLMTGTLSLSGRLSFVSQGFLTGETSISSNSPLSGWTSSVVTDIGSLSGGVYTYDTIGASDVAGGVNLSSDSAGIIAVALSEVGASVASLALNRAFPRAILNF